MHYKTHVKKIIKIQALYRAIKARRMFDILSTETKAPSKYFNEVEMKETLHGFFKMSQKPFIKSYTYKDGA